MAKQSVVKATETRELSMPEIDFFEAYANSISQSNITGRLLKFNKGDWLAGEDEDELDAGTKLVANVEQLMVGWQKWQDGKPANAQMGLLSKGFKAPSRESLGDDDESKWEVDNTGKARDPWQYTNYMIMKSPGKKEDLYTFTTSSRGGLGCIGALLKEYVAEARMRPDEYPIVELGGSSYDHPNKEYGRIKVPTMKITGWEKKSLFPAPKK